MARLQFTPPLEDLALRPVEADRAAVLKGTVQHQVLEGEAAVAVVEGTERLIDVDCRTGAGSFSAPVRFGLAASLEVSSNVRINIQGDVLARLRQEVPEEGEVQVAALLTFPGLLASECRAIRTTRTVTPAATCPTSPAGTAYS